MIFKALTEQEVKKLFAIERLIKPSKDSKLEDFKVLKNEYAINVFYTLKGKREWFEPLEPYAIIQNPIPLDTKTWDAFAEYLSTLKSIVGSKFKDVLKIQWDSDMDKIIDIIKDKSNYREPSEEEMKFINC